MPNAKNASTEGAYERVLAIGPAGSGKTTQEITLPGKVFAYIFDPNALQSLAGYDIEYEQFAPEIDDLDISVKTLKTGVADKVDRKIEPYTYQNWERHFEEALENNFFEQYDWLVFDSFTTWAETVMDRVQYLNGRLGKQPEQADWAAQINTIGNVFRVLTNLPVNLYCTGHTEIRQDGVTQRVYGHIMMPGRLRVRIPLLFTNIWACQCASTPDEELFQIQTRPDRENPTIRSSVRGLEMYQDVTIGDFSKPQKYGVGHILSTPQSKEKAA